MDRHEFVRGYTKVCRRELGERSDAELEAVAGGTDYCCRSSPRCT
jgi:hypothetical protein